MPSTSSNNHQLQTEKQDSIKSACFLSWQWKRRFHFLVLFDRVVLFAAIIEKQSLLIITGLTVQQSCFWMLLPVAKNVYFVMTARKFIN